MFSRGDQESAAMLFDCFQMFSSVSGLIENQGKSTVYFGGVNEDIHEQILQYTGFKKGELPFKYLGIPLCTKKVSVNQCQSLIEKIVGRINTWTKKFLSYAGRLQLVQSILTSIQTFWSEIILLPKKVIQKVETICKRFLWTGNIQHKGKALVAWEKVCKPKSAGGLNIIETHTWNKVAILKQLWNLQKRRINYG